MQMRRPILAVLAALSIAAALTSGCSSSKPSGGALPDAATLVKESIQSTKNVTECAPGPVRQRQDQWPPGQILTGDLTTTPQTAAQGNASIVFGGSDIDAPFVVIDGIIYGALTPGQWDNFGKASDLYDPSTILKPDVGLANLLTNLSNPKAQSRENVGGQTTIKITGTVSADAVNGIMPRLKATQPMPSTVWIEENGDHQLVQTQLEQSPGNSLQLTLSNWNAPVQVTKPPVAPAP